MYKRQILGVPAYVAPPPAVDAGDGEIGDDEGDETSPAGPACEPPDDLNCDGTVTMEEMTAYMEREMAGEGEEEAPEHACEPPEDLNCDGTVTMEEMTDFLDE